MVSVLWFLTSFAWPYLVKHQPTSHSSHSIERPFLFFLVVIFGTLISFSFSSIKENVSPIFFPAESRTFLFSTRRLTSSGALDWFNFNQTDLSQSILQYTRVILVLFTLFSFSFPSFLSFKSRYWQIRETVRHCYRTKEWLSLLFSFFPCDGNVGRFYWFPSSSCSARPVTAIWWHDELGHGSFRAKIHIWWRLMDDCRSQVNAVNQTEANPATLRGSAVTFFRESGLIRVPIKIGSVLLFKVLMTQVKD